MFVWNLPGRMTPMGISRGVNKEKTEVQPAEPMFTNKPFMNHMEEAIGPTEEYLMGYGPQGSFTPTVMATEARRKSMVQMGNNMALINLTNGKRRGLF